MQIEKVHPNLLNHIKAGGTTFCYTNIFCQLMWLFLPHIFPDAPNLGNNYFVQFKNIHIQVPNLNANAQ
jgi:hypothetical protein